MSTRNTPVSNAIIAKILDGNIPLIAYQGRSSYDRKTYWVGTIVKDAARLRKDIHNNFDINDCYAHIQYEEAAFPEHCQIVDSTPRTFEITSVGEWWNIDFGAEVTLSMRLDGTLVFKAQYLGRRLLQYVYVDLFNFTPNLPDPADPKLYDLNRLLP